MKIFKKFFVILIMFLLIPSNVMAKSKEVKINIPKFPISINGQKMEVEKSQYPPIIYNDITYFPMTYDNSEFLGVKTNWDKKSRTLKVDKNLLITGNYNGYIQNRKNNIHYTASIPDFKIIVNGKNINNTKEKYPLLIFRDITYFPLTWRFCHNEFGWDYSWNDSDGLTIKSDQRRYDERLGMSFPSAGTNKYEFENGYIEYTSQRPITNNYMLNVKYKNKEYNLGDDISEKFYPNYMGYSAPGVMGVFWEKPEVEIANKNISIFIKNNTILIPFAQAKNYSLDGGLPKFKDEEVINSVIKVNLDTGKIIDVIKLNLNEAKNYEPENYI